MHWFTFFHSNLSSLSFPMTIVYYPCVVEFMLATQALLPGDVCNGSLHTYDVTDTKMQSSWWTHWGRVTNICVSKLTIIGSDNCLSPGRRQAIIWTNDEILLIGTSEANFNETVIKIHIFSSKKTHLNVSCLTSPNKTAIDSGCLCKDATPTY